MKRLLPTLSLLLSLVLPASAITDFGDLAITRLWVSADDGDHFACTASYIFPPVNESVSWVVTAGHCTVATLIKKNSDSVMAGLVDWRGLLRDYGQYSTMVVDLAVGTVPDVRDGAHTHLWLASSTPDSGRVYIHGFPVGIESVVEGLLIPPGRLDEITVLVQTSPWDFEQKPLKEVLPGARYVLVKSGVIRGGSSGSPLLSPDGRVVGVVWGGVDARMLSEAPPDGYDLILFTPVERLHELFAALRVA